MSITLNGSGLASGVTSVPNLATFPAGPRLAQVNMPAGAVLQVVTYVDSNGSGSFSSSTTSAYNGLYSTSITPTSSSSKILILANPNFEVQRNGFGDFGVGVQILRNSTSIFADGSAYQGFYISSVSATQYIDNIRGRIPLMYLDSPSTTSQVTYYIQARAYQSIVYYGQNTGNPSTITLMEIAG
jgi:hypothetical protein